MSNLPKRPVCVDCSRRPATFHIMTVYGIANLCKPCAIVFGEFLCSQKCMPLDIPEALAGFLYEIPITFRSEITCQNRKVDFISGSLTQVVEWAAAHAACDYCMTQVFIRLGIIERPLNMSV